MLFLEDVYSQALLTMGDDEFFGAAGSVSAAGSALPLCHISRLVSLQTATAACLVHGAPLARAERNVEASTGDIVWFMYPGSNVYSTYLLALALQIR